MATRKNILIIDHNDCHYDLIREILNDSPLSLHISRSDSLLHASQSLKKKNFDHIITENYEMEGQKRWLDPIRKSTTPIIVLTSKNNEQKAVEAMKMGAHDYLIKNREALDSLEKVVSELLKKAPTEKIKFNGFSHSKPHLLSKKLKLLSEIISDPAKSFKKSGKKHLLTLEKEIDSVKQMLRNLIN